MFHIPGEDAVCHKAQIVARELQTIQQEGENQVVVTNSIGIAFSPAMAADFRSCM